MSPGVQVGGELVKSVVDVEAAAGSRGGGTGGAGGGGGASGGVSGDKL